MPGKMNGCIKSVFNFNMFCIVYVDIFICEFVTALFNFFYFQSILLFSAGYVKAMYSNCPFMTQ